MDSVTLSRTIDASPTVVRESMNRLDQFMRASGFDEVHVDGETVRVANEMGIATIELTLELSLTVLTPTSPTNSARVSSRRCGQRTPSHQILTGVKWSQRRSSRLTLRSSEMYLTQRSSNVNGEQNSQPSSTGLKKWCEVLLPSGCVLCRMSTDLGAAGVKNPASSSTS